MEYSIKQLQRAKEVSAERVDPRPVFMPVGRIRPETFNQALERIMMTSIGTGMTFQEAFDQLRPMYDYDGDFDEDITMDADDEFELSGYAEYEPEGDSSHPLSSNYVPDNNEDKSESPSTPHKSAENADGGESATADDAEI